MKEKPVKGLVWTRYANKSPREGLFAAADADDTVGAFAL